MNETLRTVELSRLADITPERMGVELRQIAKGASALDYLSTTSSDRNDVLLKSLICALTEVYGVDSQFVSHQIQRLTRMSVQFVKYYGDGPVSILRAPARINILGEHVDYVSYLPTQSLPFGSREHDMLMLYRASHDDQVRGASTVEDYPPFSFSLNDGPNAGASTTTTDWLTYLFEHPAGPPHWKNYVIGPAYLNRMIHGARLSRGFNFLVDSGIPAGGGASSSSALVVLAYAAIREVNDLPCSPQELAHQASRSEWYIGTRGGAMDHLTIALAKRDHAVLISYFDNQAEQIFLPGKPFRWLTFFSKPADKGREVMIEYNERAAVSRIVLPAIIESWPEKKPAVHERWQMALQDRSVGSFAVVEELLGELPETLTLAEIEEGYPAAFASCAQSFPALIAERNERPLRVRLRARHHLGEIRRVRAAASILHNLAQSPEPEKIDTGMRELGVLLDQSHESLRDLYGVSTDEVEELVSIVRDSTGVYGARLMGGGFGGNVLALIHEEHVDSVVDQVQAKYYQPQNRHGVIEGSVMISTPGDGLAPIDVEDVFRKAIENLNSAEVVNETQRITVNRILDQVEPRDSVKQLWPIIVAAGKGTRSTASGLTTPKPLASILGKAALVRVIENIQEAFDKAHTPLVIVSPETEVAIREGLAEEEVSFAVQPAALGTGNAVLSAREQLRGFEGYVLVIWGTQPVVQSLTMRRTVNLASLYPTHDMILPTVLKQRPYAPLTRDADGRVMAARETHLEQAEQLTYGESNVGMFLLKCDSMLKALDDLHYQYWNEDSQRYDRSSGELGFPNELISYFAKRQGVFAAPFADAREEQGIKTLADVALCEQFITELSQINARCDGD